MPGDRHLYSTADGQTTIVLSQVTRHGRAIPLVWRTVAKATLEGWRNHHEDEVLTRLHETLPAGVKVTVLADRGFCDTKRLEALTSGWGFDYVIRLRSNILVTSASGQTRLAAAWVGAGGQACTLRGASITGERQPVPTVVCVHDKDMAEPWCLAASDPKAPGRALIRLYGKRWSTETTFRDTKDLRFGMGLGTVHTQSVDRRDRRLLLSALAIVLLTLLGAAVESLGYDRMLKVNTVKRRTHSLFTQGAFFYDWIPTMPDQYFAPLMERFRALLAEHRLFTEVFGVI